MQAIGKAEIDSLLADPDFAAEKFVLISDKSTPAALLDVGFEVPVDLVEQVLDDGHIGLVDRTERIVHQLLLSGGQDSSLDPELADGLVEAEGGRNDADAADDGAVGRDLLSVVNQDGL